MFNDVHKREIEAESAALEAGAREAAAPASPRPDLDAVEAAASAFVAAGWERALRVLPIAALEDRRLGSAQREVLAWVLKTVNWNRGRCWLRPALISEETNLTVKTVQNAISGLISLGYIAKTDGRQHGPGGLHKPDLALLPAGRDDWGTLLHEIEADGKRIWRHRREQSGAEISRDPRKSVSRDTGKSAPEVSRDSGKSISRDSGKSPPPTPYMSTGDATTSDIQDSTSTSLSTSESDAAREWAGEREWEDESPLRVFEEQATALARPVTVGDAHAALALWNEAAEDFELPVARMTASRLERILGRLAEIGGLPAWRRAIENLDFHPLYIGQLEPALGRDQPFRLTLDGLLSTRSDMGDILAGLIEYQPPPPPPERLSAEELARKYPPRADDHIPF